MDLANSLDTAGKTCKMVKLLQKAKVRTPRLCLKLETVRVSASKYARKR